jgi:hypothetical protein
VIDQVIQFLGKIFKFIVISEDDPLGRSAVVDQPDRLFDFIDGTGDSMGQEDAQDG